ncbi:MAG TPA: hypothetical protein GXX75_17180 [Clostridiales bacterium]|nr:hypothetical protein [Clostridiales bacterium]
MAYSDVYPQYRLAVFFFFAKIWGVADGFSGMPWSQAVNNVAAEWRI